MSLVHSHEYDSSFSPAMPIIEVRLARRAGETQFLLEAIVDSGADATQIPLPILNRLRARSSATGWLAVASGARYRVTLYKVAIRVGSYRPLYVDVVGSQTNEVIVGRDILNQFVVTLDAPGHSVQIAE